MASPVGRLLRPGSDSWICKSCRSQKLSLTTERGRRQLHLSTIAKREEAQRSWDAIGAEIKAGKRQSMLSILEERGFINQIAGDRDKLDDLMTRKRCGIYLGIDPTAPSMHIGHLVPFMALFWMHAHGFQTVSVLGGATARFGDPTGRTNSREDMLSSTRKANIATMHMQLKRLWATTIEHLLVRHGYKREWAWSRALLNNGQWLNATPITEFLRMFGTRARVGTLLGREIFRNKMEKGDGLSFAEFTYPLLQAWDWWHLYKAKGVQLQIGGSDQYGNIMEGKEMVVHCAKVEQAAVSNLGDQVPPLEERKVPADDLPYGFTVPLLTTASGEKFGKSAGNAIWLDATMTSVYELYQFLLRSADADVEKYLKLLTFVPTAEIKTIMAEHLEMPSKRIAQRKLADEICIMVHGLEEAKKAKEQNELAHSASPQRLLDFISQPSTEEPQPERKAKFASEKWQFINRSLNPNAPITRASTAFNPKVTLPRSLVYNRAIHKVFWSAGLASSTSEAHRLCAQSGAHIGVQPGEGHGQENELKWVPAKTMFASETEKFVMEGKLLMLRVGKWKVRLVHIIDDDDFDRQGLTAPGWEEFKVEEDRKAAIARGEIPADEPNEGQEKTGKETKLRRYTSPDAE